MTEDLEILGEYRFQCHQKFVQAHDVYSDGIAPNFASRNSIVNMCCIFARFQIPRTEPFATLSIDFFNLVRLVSAVCKRLSINEPRINAYFPFLRAPPGTFTKEPTAATFNRSATRFNLMVVSCHKLRASATLSLVLAPRSVHHLFIGQPRPRGQNGGAHAVDDFFVGRTDRERVREK